MVIYIAYILIIVILSKLKLKKREFCIVSALLLVIMISFRDITMGRNDTKNLYIPNFNIIANLNMKDVFAFIEQRDTEYLFYILTKLFTYISTNEHFYIYVFGLPYVIVVSRFIYKYSKIPCMSFIIFFSVNYFGYAFYLMRHVLALSFILLSYDYIKKRKLIKFIVMVVIATLFHRTAIIFLIAYPISKLQLKEIYQFLIMVVAVLISVIFGPKIIELFFNIVSEGHFALYNDLIVKGTLTFFFINFVIWIFCFLCKKYRINNKDVTDEEKADSIALNNILVCGTIIASSIYFFPEMSRISSFFTIYSIILLPNTISYINNKKEKIAVITIVSMVFILYFFCFSMHNNMIYPYKFFFLD